MCLAIYKPSGAHIPKSALRNGFDINADGAGFAFATGTGFATDKAIGLTFREFYRLFRSVEKRYPNAPAIVHFRYATNGPVCNALAHPFFTDSGRFAVIHNGILSVRHAKDESDSVAFVRDYISPLESFLVSGPEPVRAAVLRTLSLAANPSKLVLLPFDGSAAVFLNESFGQWNDGVWYSNSDYKTRPAERFAYVGGKNWKGHFAGLAAKDSDRFAVAAPAADYSFGGSLDMTTDDIEDEDEDADIPPDADECGAADSCELCGVTDRFADLLYDADGLTLCEHCASRFPEWTAATGRAILG